MDETADKKGLARGSLPLFAETIFRGGSGD